MQADALAWLGMTSGGVASLNHEVEDDAMPKVAIVEAFIHQLQEVITMLGRFVVEHKADVAHRGFQQYFGLQLWLGVGLSECTQTNYKGQ